MNISEILDRLERIDHKEYNTAFDFADSSSFDEVAKCFKERRLLAEEIERLNNIINELEKYCKEDIEEGNKALEQLSMLYNSSETEIYIKVQQAKCNNILDKLQELKGESK